MRVESKSLTKYSLDFHFKITHKYCIFSNKYTRRLFSVKAKGRHLLEEDDYLKKRRVIHMKFENFVIVSFQIT